MSYLVSVLVWLLLYATTVNICRATCRNPPGGDGDIRVIGMVNATVIAGRMEICDGMEWRAVCHDGWDLEDAMVVCRQLHFNPRGAGYCRHSCFGENNIKAIRNFDCQSNESRLIECSHPPDATPCPKDAGVTCGLTDDPAVYPPPPTLPTHTPPSNITPTIPPNASQEGNTGAGEEQIGKTTTCIAIGGGLGALAAGLALILVGVVMGWVCHCHRSREKCSTRERSSSGIPNPNYTNTVLTQPPARPHPSNQYSSHGPSNPAANYDVLESPGLSRGNHAHKKLPLKPRGRAGGLNYEVPTPTKMPVQQDPTDMDYSKLQHK